MTSQTQSAAPSIPFKSKPGLSTSAPQRGGRKLGFEEFASLQNLVIGVLIVLGLAFVLLLMESFTAREIAYEELRTQIAEQNAKIDLLYQAYVSKEQPQNIYLYNQGQ